jgi:hypothetical protein
MEAVRTSETSTDNYFTRHYVPKENSELHTRRRENFKSHSVNKDQGGLNSSFLMRRIVLTWTQGLKNLLLALFLN